MKRFLLTISVVIIAIAMLAACAPQKTQGDSEQQADTTPGTYVEIKAVIQDVQENQLFVHILEGLDDIEDIYLNYRDDTKINISEDAPLEPGIVVTAIIGNEIMESDPPQAVLYEVVSTEPGDSTGGSDNTDGTQLMPDDYIVGKVITIDGDTYTIEVISANLYEGDMTLTIPTDVQVDNIPIVQGYLIGVYIAEDGGTYTVQRIVFSEPDHVIELDDRERISGFLGGMFPSAVYGEADESITVKADTPFAIGLAEPNDCVWTAQLPEGITLVADGTNVDSLPDDMSSDTLATHYFAISADTAGAYTLVFTRPDVNGGEDVTHTVTLTVE